MWSHWLIALVALTFSRGTNGQLIVLDVEEKQNTIKVTRESWGEKQAARYIVWNKFDDGITGILPAKNLRKSIRAKGIGALCEADKAMILARAIKAELKKFEPISNFQPCPIADNDEMYPNGIFEFNITKMLTFIKSYPNKFPVERVALKGLHRASATVLTEATVLTANLDNPIILAEISPGRFNVIDGNHRIERAHRDGLDKIPAYRVSADQHLVFLTSEKAYKLYIEYWNSKIDDEIADLR